MLPRPEVILKPIHPSAGLEEWYRRRLQKLIRAMAKSMLLHLRAAYRNADFALDASADGSVSMRRALEEWAPRWVSKFDNIAARVSLLFADRSTANLDARMMKTLEKSGFAIRFKATRAMRQAYKAVVAENVNLIKSIPQQFLKDVQSSVWQSVMNGRDLSGLTQHIQKNYGVAYRRAQLIARDQNNKAKAAFERARRQELGITEAIWVHSGGGKEPRPEHLRWGRDKKRFEVKKGIWSDVDKQYVWPGMAINCRCTSRAVIPGIN